MRALALFTLLPATALTAILDVDVGENGLVFGPDTLTAATGDTVVFHFYPGAHSVAQSTFASPCQPLSGGIWSGVFSPTNGEDSNVFEVTIANTDPIWIYCAQVGHCNAGMDMVINPPSGDNTLAAYKSAAQNANLIVPSIIEGGTVTPATAVISETSSSIAASSPASSTAPTSSAPASSAPATSAVTPTSTASSSAAPSSPSAGSPPPTTSASSVSASVSASGAGTTTGSSSVATSTGSSNRNTVNAFLAVAGAGAFGLAILY